jgi:hypothetical protein
VSLYPGKVGERFKDAEHQLFRPIAEAMAKQGISRKELHKYLYARHVQERNAQVWKIDPANDVEAQAILDNIRSSGRQPNFDATELVDAVIAHNQDVMEREGLEHSKALLRRQQAYRHYVPLKRAKVSEDEYGRTPSRGKSFLTRWPEPLGALGRYSLGGDLLANILDQTQRTIIGPKKDPVAKTFLRFAHHNRSRLYNLGLAETRRRPNPVTGMVKTIWVTTNVDHDSLFAAKVGGETYHIKIEHDGLLIALKGAFVIATPSLCFHFLPWPSVAQRAQWKWLRLRRSRRTGLAPLLGGILPSTPNCRVSHAVNRTISEPAMLWIICG